MKHMNRLHSQVVASGGFTVAQEAIAQEGFVDGVKDFFTFKAKSENANQVTNTANALRGLGRNTTSLRPFTDKTPVEAMRFLYRGEKQTRNLPQDIARDVGTLKDINQALSGVVGLLKSAKLADEGNEIEKALTGIIKTALKTLDDQTLLGNFYLSFEERGTAEYDGSHVDQDIDPKFAPHGSSGIGGLLMNTVFYIFDRNAAVKNMDRLNEVLKDTDLKALGTAAASVAGQLETSARLIQEFLTEYDRLKKSDNKHVRHVLRYGHNIIYLVTIAARPYRAFAHYVV